MCVTGCSLSHTPLPRLCTAPWRPRRPPQGCEASSPELCDPEPREQGRGATRAAGTPAIFLSVDVSRTFAGRMCLPRWICSAEKSCRISLATTSLFRRRPRIRSLSWSSVGASTISLGLIPFQLVMAAAARPGQM